MHTQGPWSRNIKPASKYNTIFAGRNTHVAHLSTAGLSEEEIESNANLIVAAPDMLLALELALQNLIYPRTHPAVSAALAAIAKAKG